MTDIYTKRFDMFAEKDRLSKMTEIPDMLQYASEWLQLADAFQATNMPSNANYCRARGEHYSQMAGGAYVKIVDGCFAELTKVQ